MLPNIHQILIHKSSVFKALTCFLVFFAIFPQNSIQQTIVTGTCTYSYDSATGHYSCRLNAGVISNPLDVLNIEGTHLQGKTDSDVKIVWYPGNNMYYLNGDILKKFENLMIFKLDCIALKEINQDAFEYCPNLEQFISKLSNLTTYPPQMMKNCEKLKIFRSIDQDFTEIPEIFGDITSLEELDLSENFLTSLPEKLVQNKPNLKIFNVHQNRLTELAPNFFENCTNLQEVDVSSNSFEDQVKLTRAFNGNTNLKKLGIYTNKFTNFDFTFFSQFDQLQMLAVGTVESKLTQISWQSLPSSLTDLSIQSIGEEIPENSLNHLVNLVTFSLSGTGISSFHKDTFKAQTELKILSIQDTNLNSLHPELFASQANIVDLTLRYNKIEELPAGIFAPLSNLGMSNTIFGLKLSGNKVKRLNTNSFGQHPHLQYLDFGNNEINAIQRGLFSHFNLTIYRANFNSNLCIDKLFSNAYNLDEDESLQWCFDSYEGITTTTSTTTSTTSAPPTTTPSGCGNNYKKFEMFGIIFIAFLAVLMNFMK